MMGKAAKIILVLILFFTASFLISRNFNSIDFSDKIVFIPIKGVILSGDGNGIFNEERTLSTDAVDYLTKAESDSTVKAIILEVNSPGGSVIGSKEIAEKVKGMKKPVVAWVREVGASGAYWIASASDAIVADPLSITGSIGVIGSYLEFEKLFDKYGITYERLVTGKYKDLGSAYKGLNDEERNLLQGKLDLIHKAFVEDVSKNRGRNLEKYATGEFFLGSEAYKLGLIDYLGSKETAINVSKELAKIEKAKIVTFKTKKGLFDSVDKYFTKYSYFFGLGISGGFLAKEKFEINA
ncbi:signal peptide peptidase SppA [Candidatus Woesearchaeota archaeon]|nr:signal peptide peptidase SppA [Candidatus Woesearchaeota archaeon]